MEQASRRAFPENAWGPRKRRKTPVIDGLMHLENCGRYWEGLFDEVIEHYNYAGIDKGVILTMYESGRDSNDRTLRAYQKYPDRFIPFGHVKPEDLDWEDQLKRVSEPPWQGLKLHESELGRDGRDLKETTRKIVTKARDVGIPIVKIHLGSRVGDMEIMDELTREIPDIIWIFPHMGCYGMWHNLEKVCRLAKERENVYLDTSAFGPYYLLGKAVQWTGVEKITFASDGHDFKPLVEKAKVETLQLPNPFRTPRLADEQLDMIMGGNMERILGL